ncbi:hypothetical protein CBU02nite_39160 [Clostridium butyricum]|uniref:Uncharacterized protein n=1 Tax=Clostridium butyricum TaxID=1492 RepID=A0A512TSZ9_CLOBU|nr:hypothetical protein [Clostridium butyricum]NOW25235.1 hypothetical protein [Clostridium butyricum]GEQ23410.1 hypothetical protein CBU02nite_39160 [Clostridium butyricum]
MFNKKTAIRDKQWLIRGRFNLDNVNYIIEGKVYAVSAAQADYYACLEIRRMLNKHRFITLNLYECRTLSSSYNYIRKMPMGINLWEINIINQSESYVFINSTYEQYNRF